MKSKNIKKVSMIVASCITIALAVTILSNLRRDQLGLTPLTGAPLDTVREAELPTGTVTIYASSAANTVAPMILKETATGPDTPFLSIPPSAGRRTDGARTSLPFKVVNNAEYQAWARVRWDDSCGNSLLFSVNDEKPVVIGQDSVYSSWHWVSAGGYSLQSGNHSVTLKGREDGIALSQLMFVPDPDYVPSGAVISGREQFQPRRFADDFSRSPGSGLGPWKILSGKWGIEFSLDPNRIPYQYALRASPGTNSTGALALIEGPAWSGCKLSFAALLTEPGEFGIVLGAAPDGTPSLTARIAADTNSASLVVSGNGIKDPLKNEIELSPHQWNEVVIEHWAWVLSISINGETVFTHYNTGPHTGSLGFLAKGSDAIFDNIEIHEDVWYADNGADLKIPWAIEENASWFRPSSATSSIALLGRSGTISMTPPDLTPVEVLLEQPAGSNTALNLNGFTTILSKNGMSLLHNDSRTESVSIEQVTGDAPIKRVAFHCGVTETDSYTLGPYDFSRRSIEDPSDYLDFTDEEYEEIRNSPDSAKLRREKKMRPLVASSPYAIWRPVSRYWRVANGVMSTMGPNAAIRYWQEIISDFTMKLKVDLEYKSTAEIEIFGGDIPGPTLRITNLSKTDKPASQLEEQGCLTIDVPADGRAHDIALRVAGTNMAARLNSGDWVTTPIQRSHRGAILIKVPGGAASFDDIAFEIPREGLNTLFYGFDKRETDWIRQGAKWIDHGGIACVLASSWISLVAPAEQGVLWNRRPTGSNVTVAFNVEETSDWYGWDRRQTHKHHPTDNIQAFLSPTTDPKSGYRLEVNSRNRQATVLYRDNREVAVVQQDDSFPIRFTNGHSPYSPRRSRISLTKEAGLIRVSINGKEVLSYKDPSPIAVDRVGVGGYNTRFNLSHIEIGRH